MRACWLISAAVLSFLTGCTTPFNPPVLAAGGETFPGLVDLIQSSGGRPVDVVLIHGMCTHDKRWADEAIDALSTAVNQNLSTPPSTKSSVDAAAVQGIQIVPRQVELAGGLANFSALVWSPLTAKLKEQLAYDHTGQVTDCSTAAECKPRRALLNGLLKDELLNDCLADAMAYQGASRHAIRDALVQALTKVLSDTEAPARPRSTPGPLMIVSASLGSKMIFDALVHMIDGNASVDAKAAGESAVGRLSVLMMGANQLPILGLADQDIGVDKDRVGPLGSGPEDPLARLLQVRERQTQAASGSQVKRNALSQLSVVAFTDPNDLLSYRLQPSRYASPTVRISDVLVSNDNTYFGLLERPDTAHKKYFSNPAVATLVACGKVKNAACK